MKIVTHSSRFRFGFTLVELMVVISVIGILSAIVYANFGDSRKIARDNIRKTDIKNLQIAVELYKAQNGVYPDGCKGDNQWSGGSNSPGVGFACSAGVDYIIGLVPDYIAELPRDPKATGDQGYLYRSGGGLGKANQYKIMANASVEKMFVNDYSDDFGRCPNNKNVNWCESTDPNNPQPNSYAVYKGTNAEGW